MPWLTDFFNAYIIEIYLVYGLGFFIMGMAVALEAGHASALPLARATPWLAGFGILHGLAEWTDMFVHVSEQARGQPPSLTWEAVGVGLELMSFLWLLRFGCELRQIRNASIPGAPRTGALTQRPAARVSLSARVRRLRTRCIITAVLAVFVAGLAIISWRLPVSSILWVKVVDVWASYAIGAPAFALTIWGLIGQSRSFRAQGWPDLAREMTGAAIAFTWYAMFDSLFVPRIPYPPASIINSTLFIEIVGVPIQLFRAANAIVIAFFFIRALRFFAAVDRRRLHAAIETERTLQASAETLNQSLREAAKEMSTLYEQLRQRDEVHSHLLNRVVRAQEEERRRVARDLHDGVGQTLSGLAAGLAALESRSERQDSEIHKQMVMMKTYAMQAVDELHRVIMDLRPSLLDDLGLVPALRWYARQYRQTLRLDVTVHVQGAARRFPPEVEIVLFRIAQEALTNVVRHARANSAAITLETHDNRVTLTIADDGIGFDPHAAFAASGDGRPWGLLGMRERAALVGGFVDIQSQAWHGTTVIVEIPLPPPEMEQENHAHPSG